MDLAPKERVCHPPAGRPAHRSGEGEEPAHRDSALSGPSRARAGPEPHSFQLVSPGPSYISSVGTGFASGGKELRFQMTSLIPCTEWNRFFEQSQVFSTDQCQFRGPLRSPTFFRGTHHLRFRIPGYCFALHELSFICGCSPTSTDEADTHNPVGLIRDTVWG